MENIFTLPDVLDSRDVIKRIEELADQDGKIITYLIRA